MRTDSSSCFTAYLLFCVVQNYMGSLMTQDVGQKQSHVVVLADDGLHIFHTGAVLVRDGLELGIYIGHVHLDVFRFGDGIQHQVSADILFRAYCMYWSSVILRLSRFSLISSTIWVMRSSIITAGISILALFTAVSIRAFSYSVLASRSAASCMRFL